MKRLSFVILLLLLGAFSCSNSKSMNNDILLVHFIDVGQGDAILVEGPSGNMLIDAGPREEKDKLFKYLKSNNIHKIDYIISTHPHEDHIGNMAEVIKSFDFKEFYAPKVVHNSPTFEKMVEALVLKDKKINVLKPDCTTPNLGEKVNIQVFSPIKDQYENLNNYSPIIKLTYGNTSFLFTGDAEKEIEDALVKNNSNIKSDVLKIGHHGSTTSTSSNFLDIVSPSIAVISVGVNNSYGHPKPQTLNLLEKKNIQIFRTDKLSSITLISDGTNIKFPN